MSLLHPLAYQLGAPMSAYTSALSRRITLIFSVLCCAFGLFTVTDLILHQPPAQEHGIMAFIALSSGVGTLIYWFRQRGLAVQVYEQGLLYTRQGNTQVIRWTDIAVVRQDVTQIYIYFIPVSTTRCYTIETTDGKRIKFKSNLGRVAELGQLMQDKTFPRLFADAVERIRRGENVAFGPVELNAQGIQKRNMLLPWHELNEVTGQSGEIVIKKQGVRRSWTRLAVSKLPNIAVFLALIAQLHAEHSRNLAA